MDELKISLPLYEGPLDLLLDMIRKQKIDIYDIPIAKVTEQYLAYLHLMQEMDVDLASEFLAIAAQLIYIKSKMLLPPDPDASPEEQEDPRQELVRRLLEYERFRNAAEMLHQRETIENAVWSNPGPLPFDEGAVGEGQLTVSLYDLMLAFRDIIRRAEQRRPLEVNREEFSIEQMMGYLFEKIAAARGPLSLSRALPDVSTKRGVICAFLALLELTRLKAIFLSQDKPFGEINALANPDYELSQSFSPA
ncbi:MAG TPA: segregation/condensation protein A [Terriglobia bacterium]|nr:segregation/condensation protein A [Terriglobia bacterium]